MECPRCGAVLTEITSSLGDGEVTMRSCPTCETKTWVRDGAVLDIREVLELTAEQHGRRSRQS